MKLALSYKNFAANRNISHIGLGVAALNTQKCLRREAISTAVWPILNSADLCNRPNRPRHHACRYLRALDPHDRDADASQ